MAACMHGTSCMHWLCPKSFSRPVWDHTYVSHLCITPMYAYLYVYNCMCWAHMIRITCWIRCIVCSNISPIVIDVGNSKTNAKADMYLHIYLGPSLSGRKISAPAYKPPMLVARRVQSLPALIVLRRAESSSSWSSSRATSVEICLSLGSFPPLRVLSIAASRLFTNDAVHFGLLLETRTAEYADSTTDC